MERANSTRTTVSGGTAWAERGACRSLDPDALFVEGAAQQDAKGVCRPCPVRTECLAYALDSRIEKGIWGGMTERERRALLRRRPTVTSWRALLMAARSAHEAAVRGENDRRGDACRLVG
ncbi:WhiB family transcriptional regulator [Streptomyces beihaiensis]|uniref:Transcriptional regulator WhiB n=1 Tax=Streptomyces beihaiensis TaxID=2984495 RepID=A0ABT3TP65_9ACTN|nr:WhiB family transcriptional regulator [Streptomyces beihaiensis]MCX3058806.1 WhiB family transcriptional regulator [Streptomyces beihaiensis]